MRNSAVSGVWRAGFKTTALPAASAGPILWATSSAGIVEGRDRDDDAARLAQRECELAGAVRAPSRPAPSRRACARPPRRSCGGAAGIRAASPRASASGLPTSSAIVRASSSAPALDAGRRPGAGSRRAPRPPAAASRALPRPRRSTARLGVVRIGDRDDADDLTVERAPDLLLAGRSAATRLRRTSCVSSPLSPAPLGPAASSFASRRHVVTQWRSMSSASLRLPSGHGLERGAPVSLDARRPHGDGLRGRERRGTAARRRPRRDAHDAGRSPRGVYCGMGVCFDCLVVVDGVPNTRACVTWVREGMVVARQDGLVAASRPVNSAPRRERRSSRPARRSRRSATRPSRRPDTAARRARRRPSSCKLRHGSVDVGDPDAEVHRPEVAPRAAAVVSGRVEHDGLDRGALGGHRHRHVLGRQVARGRTTVPRTTAPSGRRTRPTRTAAA